MHNYTTQMRHPATKKKIYIYNWHVGLRGGSPSSNRKQSWTNRVVAPQADDLSDVWPTSERLVDLACLPASWLKGELEGLSKEMIIMIMIMVVVGV